MDPVSQAPAAAPFLHTLPLFAGLSPEDCRELKRYAALLLTEGLTTVEEVTSVVSVED